MVLDEAGGRVGAREPHPQPLPFFPVVPWRYFWVTLELQMSFESHWSDPTFPFADEEAEAQSG